MAPFSLKSSLACIIPQNVYNGHTMKILYSITKSNWGGAQKYVHDLALASSKAGHEVSVLVGGNGVLAHKLKSENIRVISLPSLVRDVRITDDIKSVQNIYSILKKEQPDIFHINSSKMGLMGTIAARLARVKQIIFTAHGWEFNAPRPWWQQMLIEEAAWFTVLLSHKTICVSEAVKKAVEGKPFISHKLFVVKNGIEPLSLPPRKRTDSGLVVGTVAELHRVKGIDVAIRAFARAFKYTDASYEIIGEGDDRAYLENLIKSLGMESQIKLLGFMENAREKLSEFDIFVLPSRSEALGLVLLEAGEARLAVAASRVGGIPEVIEDGVSGLLFESQRFQELADVLKKLSEDKELREELGKNLYQRVTAHFSKKRMIEETMRLYDAY